MFGSSADKGSPSKSGSGSTASDVPTVKIPYKPPVPQYGGVREVGADSWAAWTGGMPKGDWTGLEQPKPASINPGQYRSNSISGMAKSQVYRVQGLETKFTKDSNLLIFQKEVMEHLTQHGLDTITYIQDPVDNDKVVSVLTEHARFTLKEGCEAGNDYNKMQYDEYDLENIRDARKFLLNSVDEHLKTQLYQNCKDEDSFVAVWFNLIHLVRSVSINRFDKIKERIKERQISQYSGENIEELVTDYIADWQELHDAGLYDHNLTMTMLNKLLEAGGENNEDFCHPLRSTKTELNKKLLEIRHKNYFDAHADLVAANLDVLSVTKLVKNQYRELLDDGKWPAAAHAKDSKAVNRNYGSVNMVKEIRKVVASLVQNTPSGRDKSGDECNNCGDKGHWARDCPKKKGTCGPNSRNKSLRNNPGKGGPRRGGVNRIPPKDGESEIKFIDGKKSYWCAKCRRWTLSHGTDGHVAKEQMKHAKIGMARLDLHPSAYGVKGPLFKPSVNQVNLKRKVMYNYFLIGLLGASFCYLLWQTPILELLMKGVQFMTQFAEIGSTWFMEQVPK